MMQNNSLGTVAVSNSKRPRARFNMSSDLHTSMDFGSVIPARVQMMVPNSKVVASSHEKIWCSPLLAPTMGRLGLKVYHNFVRLSDLSENFAPMLAQQPVGRNAQEITPLYVPCATIKDLSFTILYGSYLNIYKHGASSGDGTGDDASASTATCSVYSGSSGVLSSDSDLSALDLLTQHNYHLWNNIPLCFSLNIGHMFYGTAGASAHNTMSVALSNPTNATFYSIDPTCDFYEQYKDRYDLSDVTPENADIVLPYNLTDSSGTVTATYYLCFRLSDAGKRLRKILIGCGYQIDFTNEQVVSLLPLFAFYKSYFDVFGLTLYTNWEESLAYRTLRLCDLSATPNIQNFWTNGYSVTTPSSYLSMFLRFVISDLMRCYYTDEQDFVSAHSTTTGTSPSAAAFISSINADVDYSGANQARVSDGSVQLPQQTLPGNPNGHSWINNVIHGQLDSELLKRLYRWTNRNTIAGRRIAELLRAQGYGAYVDECKSDFIGAFEVPISVYDGISQSDTYSQVSDSGAPLGERFGSAEADSSKYNDAERPFTFECNEFGYWVTLFTIVPKGGYAEAIDPTVLATSKFQFYNPEFDSLGMEFDPKSLVTGSMPFADFTLTSGKLSDSFGLAPRFFRWKFGRNVANGDFTRRGVRDAFAPYYLDKIIDVGSRRIRDTTTGSQYKTFVIAKDFKASMLPIAGNVWRYPTRYPFIGRFGRIFNKSFGDREHFSMTSVSAQVQFEYFSGSEDNFIVHTIFDIQYFAPMLPVEDSFETYDDDNGVNGSMSKA